MKLFYSDYSKQPQQDILVMIGESEDNCTDLCTFKSHNFTMPEYETAWQLRMFDDAWKFLAEDCVINLLTEISENTHPINTLQLIHAIEIPITHSQKQNS